MNIANLISPLLKKYRYRDKKDPFEAFLSLRKQEELPEADQGNVLILPVRVSPLSNLFEGLIGYALKQRGYNVHALMCGQSLTACDNITQQDHFYLSCALCKHEQTRFLEAFGLSKEAYSDNISKETQGQLVTLSKNVPIDEIFEFKYEEINVGKYVKDSVSRSLLISNIDRKANETLIRNFFLTTLITVEVTRTAVKKLNPKFVLTSHGIYSTWGTALETCSALGYRGIVWGRGYVGGNIIASQNVPLSQDAIYNDSSMYWENIPVDERAKKELDTYFEEKRNPNSGVDIVNYYKDIAKKSDDIFEYLKLDKSRPRIGVYPNIPWDGAMLRKSKGFPDMNVFAEAIVEWAQLNPHVDVIIRAHPVEGGDAFEQSGERFIDLIYRVCEHLPDNIKYIEPTMPISSYELSNICSAALMYASTLSLELAYMRHPVIQAGQIHLSNKNLLFEGHDKETLFNLLDKAVRGELKVDDAMYDRLVRYTNYWINKRHIPEELINRKKLIFDGYTFGSSNELKPGHFKTLDWFIDRCIDGRPFVWGER